VDETMSSPNQPTRRTPRQQGLELGAPWQDIKRSIMGDLLCRRLKAPLRWEISRKGSYSPGDEIWVRWVAVT
jgi:hypothetical protein